MAAAHPLSTNIPQRMDRLPWSRWHWLIVTALGITWILDGLEVSIVSALGPVLTHPTTLGLSESQVGLTASAYLTGAVCGAFVFSYLTDRQGRNFAKYTGSAVSQELRLQSNGKNVVDWILGFYYAKYQSTMNFHCSRYYF